jgi:hypothetical protein
MQNVNIEVEKFKSSLVSSKTEQLKLQAFIDSLPEGAKVEVYYSVVLDPSEKSLGQLAKVHVLIKQLASDTGHTVAEIKEEIKTRSGIIDVSTGEVKSFRDCSKSELASAIQTCIDLGNEVGSYLH